MTEVDQLHASIRARLAQRPLDAATLKALRYEAALVARLQAERPVETLTELLVRARQRAEVEEARLSAVEDSLDEAARQKLSPIASAKFNSRKAR